MMFCDSKHGGRRRLLVAPRSHSRHRRRRLVAMGFSKRSISRPTSAIDVPSVKETWDKGSLEAYDYCMAYPDDVEKCPSTLKPDEILTVTETRAMVYCPVNNQPVKNCAQDCECYTMDNGNGECVMNHGKVGCMDTKATNYDKCAMMSGKCNYDVSHYEIIQRERLYTNLTYGF